MREPTERVPPSPQGAPAERIVAAKRRWRKNVPVVEEMILGRGAARCAVDEPVFDNPAHRRGPRRGPRRFQSIKFEPELRNGPMAENGGKLDRGREFPAEI
jgi:hypothetical protein